MSGAVPQSLGSLVYVRLRVAHISGTEVAVVGRLVVTHVQFSQLSGDLIEQLAQAGTGVAGHVIDLVLVFIGGGRR